MRFRLILAVVCTLALGATPALAKSGPCKDDKGKFIKCPAAAAAPAAPKAAPVEKPKSGPCKDEKGKFIKCSANPTEAKSVTTAPAAKPAPAAAPAPAAKPAASPKAATVKASSTDPAGATGKCKDGTYTHSKTHSGACSHHGGVASWIN
jgi:hypothetical protein